MEFSDENECFDLVEKLSKLKREDKLNLFCQCLIDSAKPIAEEVEFLLASGIQDKHRSDNAN